MFLARTTQQHMANKHTLRTYAKHKKKYVWTGETQAQA